MRLRPYLLHRAADRGLLCLAASGLLQAARSLHGVGVGTSRDHHGRISVASLHTLVVHDVLREVLAAHKWLVTEAGPIQISHAWAPDQAAVRQVEGMNLLRNLSVWVLEAVLGLDDARLGGEVVTSPAALHVVVHHLLEYYLNHCTGSM